MKSTTPEIQRSQPTKLRKTGIDGGTVKGLGLGLALGITFLAMTASADVVGYFKFDNFPGGNFNFTDDASKGLRGLLGFPFSQPVSVPGPSGQASDRAVYFDGKGALAVDDSSAQNLNILTPPLTMECWVRSTNAAQVGVHLGLVSYGIPGGPAVPGLVRGGYKLGINPAGNILFTLFAVVDVQSDVPFPFDGEWHHLAAVYSVADGGVHFYLDGLEAAFVAETRNLTPPGTRHLDIGAQFTGIGRFDGVIDRVRISKADLTPAQLDSVANTVKPVGNNTAIFLDFDKAGPPYQGQGLPPAGQAISTADWVINHPPYSSSGGPLPSAAGPVKATDTPSGAANDLAIQFGGTTFRTDMAAVWDPNGVLSLDADWTLEAWVKTDAAPDGDRDVVFYYGYPGHGYSLSVNYQAGNKLQVTTLGIADMPADKAVVELGVWQHLAVAHKKGQSITYFINGAEAGTRSYTSGSTLAVTNRVLYIGAEWNGGLPFTGLIDRIRISNTALTAGQLDSNPKIPASVPAPAPTLRLAVARSQSNVILSWPETDSAGYILEFSDVLLNAKWSPEPTAPVVAAGQRTATVPIGGSARYYRLKRP